MEHHCDKSQRGPGGGAVNQNYNTLDICIGLIKPFFLCRHSRWGAALTDQSLDVAWISPGGFGLAGVTEVGLCIHTRPVWFSSIQVQFDAWMLGSMMVHFGRFECAVRLNSGPSYEMWFPKQSHLTSLIRSLYLPSDLVTRVLKLDEMHMWKLVKLIKSPAEWTRFKLCSSWHVVDWFHSYTSYCSVSTHALALSL